MLLVLPPAKELAEFVDSYWIVEDLPGRLAGHPIQTSPVPNAVLSVNLGRPSASEDGNLVPKVSLLGLQSRSRTWRSKPNTYFVMAMLTARGIAHLFPYTGSETAGRLIDLAALIGDGPTTSLAAEVSPEQDHETIVARMDQWLASRLRRMTRCAEHGQIAIAHTILSAGGTVATAAGAAQISRRQLHRLFQRHIGVGPKELANLERLHSSLRNAQFGPGDPAQGFSDQSHQVRNWKYRLGVTPGAYIRSTPSALATETGTNSAPSRIAYFL